MTTFTALKHPSGFFPIAMSLAALAVVLAVLVSSGPAPQADEGTAAHIFQILLAAQVPIIVYFCVRWVPRSPRQGVVVVALQAAAALAALAPVYLLHW